MRQTHGGETNVKKGKHTGIWYSGIDNIAECPRATQLEFDTVSLDHEQHAEGFVAVDVASRRRILQVTVAGPCSSGIEIHCEIGTTAKVIGRNDDTVNLGVDHRTVDKIVVIERECGFNTDRRGNEDSDANEELNGSVHVQ